MKIGKFAGVFLFVVSATAIACTIRAMPPFMISISWYDVAVATVQGYSNPMQAAMLKNLDSAGENLFGSAWKTDQFNDYITYTTPSIMGAQGTHIQYTEKECNKKAIENASKGSTGSTASGGGGGYSWSGGRVYGGGTCLYGCGTVTVGDPENAEQ